MIEHMTTSKDPIWDKRRADDDRADNAGFAILILKCIGIGAFIILCFLFLILCISSVLAAFNPHDKGEFKPGDHAIFNGMQVVVLERAGTREFHTSSGSGVAIALDGKATLTPIITNDVSASGSSYSTARIRLPDLRVTEALPTELTREVEK